LTLLDPAFFRKIGERLLEWWYRNRRDYPWRHESDPYRILIAEIMLQRTKAEQVVPVYLEFLRRYPTIGDLAAADLSDVEAFFSRLGLKWRASKVIEMARYIVEKLGGRIPDERDKLLEIPMIGEYIADAVLAFAYGKDVAVVDANVVRIIERVLCMKPRGEARRDPRFRAVANMMLPQGKAREFNWAMIDFSALICRPQNPRCDECPLRDLCCYAKKKA